MSENMGICAYKVVEKNLDKSIKQLVRYGVKSGLIPEREQCYSTIYNGLINSDTFSDRF